MATRDGEENTESRHGFPVSRIQDEATFLTDDSIIGNLADVNQSTQKRFQEEPTVDEAEVARDVISSIDTELSFRDMVTANVSSEIYQQRIRHEETVASEESLSRSSERKKDCFLIHYTLTKLRLL